MKKFNKALAVISSVLITVLSCVTGVLSVSADSNIDEPISTDYSIDPSRIAFTAEIAADYLPDNKYRELWIDEDFNWGEGIFTKEECAMVRIPDGSEPPYLEGEETFLKLTKAQLADMKQNSCWGTIYQLDDVDLTDSVYSIRGFENYGDMEKYCKRLLSEEIADYARPVTVCYYSSGMPAPNAVKNMEEAGIDNTGFVDDVYGRYILTAGYSTSESAEKLKALIKDDVSAITEKDNVIYFQFSENTDPETVINALKYIDADDELEFGVYSMALHSENNEPIGGVPHLYEQGDVNRNDEIDLYDAIDIAKYLVKNKVFDDVEMCLADYNEDDEIGLYDVIGIAKSLVKT